MDFTLNREQELVRKMIRAFAETEVKPIAAEIDRNCEYPRENVEKLEKILGGMNDYQKSFLTDDYIEGAEKYIKKMKDLVAIADADKGEDGDKDPDPTEPDGDGDEDSGEESKKV